MQRLRAYFLPVIAFLLPWQTRWIYGQELIAGEAFQLGVMSLYVIEVLAIAGLFLMYKQKTSRATGPVRLALLLVALGVISSLWAINDDLVFAHIVHLVAAISIFVLAFDDRVSARNIVWGFVLGLIIPTLIGLWQVVGGGSGASTLLGMATRDAQALGDAVLVVGGERMLRAYGSLPHPNIFGGYLAMGLLGVLWLYKGAAQNIRRLLIPLGLLLFVGLVITFSRSAWIGFALALFLIVARSLTAKVHGLRAWLALDRGARLATAIIIIVIVLLSPLIASRFSFDNLVESRSITERVEQYETFGELIFERPLLGVGLNNYTLAIAEINPGNEWWEYQPVHNVWALMVGELGIVSLVFVFGGLVSVLRIHRHRIWLLCIGLTPLFIISLFDHYLWTLWPGIALVALSAAVVTRINSQG